VRLTYNEMANELGSSVVNLTKDARAPSFRVLVGRALAVVAVILLVAVVGIQSTPQGSRSVLSRGPATVLEGAVPTALSFVQMRWESYGIGGAVTYEVDVAHPDGSGLRTLIAGTEQFNSFSGLAWSPDGTKVAFARQFFAPGPGAIIGHGEMVVMNADGSDAHVVRPCDHGQCVTGLAWSPDGQRLAYTYREAIGVMDADGSHDRFFYQCRLDRPGCLGFIGRVAWSPDGSTILFNGEDRDTVGGLFLLDVANGHLRPIIRCHSELCYGGDREANPAWSPDGSLIVFHRERNLFLVRPDGSGLTQLTDCPKTNGYDPCTADWPAWSPDGREIAFTDGHAIYLMGPDGTGRHALIHAPTGTPTASPGSPSGERPSRTNPAISYSLCCVSWRPGAPVRLPPIVTPSISMPPPTVPDIPPGIGTTIVAADWPQFGNTADHLGANTEEDRIGPGNVITLAPTWRSSTGDQALLGQSPVVVDDQLFVGGFDGNLYAFRASGCGSLECAPEWFGSTGGAIRSTAAVGLGTVFVGSSAGLFAFPASGCGRTECPPRWQGDTGEGTIEFSSPSLSGDVVYVGTSTYDARLYAFDAKGCGAKVCSPLWVGTGFSDSGVWSAPAVSDGFVYVRGMDPYLYVFPAGGCGLEECDPLWKGRVLLGTSEATSAPVVANGFVYVGSGDCTVGTCG
jgi:outer membrane protein assembly factor BamB